VITSKQAAAFIQGNGVVLAVVGGLGFVDAAIIAYLFEWEADDE